LLGENLDACFAQCFVIGAKFFLHRRAARFRLLPRTFRSSVAFREHALDWPKKAPAHEEIKKKNDDDGWQCRQKQIAELAKNSHRLFRASDHARTFLR